MKFTSMGQPTFIPLFQITASALLAVCVASTSFAQQPPPGEEDLQAEPITIAVGTSRVIRPEWPVARVSITDPEIADIQVLTPRQILLTAKSLGGTDLIMWNEQEEARYHRVYVNIDLSYVREELERVLPDALLEVTQSRDLVVITGGLRRLEDSDRLRALLDGFGVKYIDATRIAGVHQVLLHVRVAEVSRRALRTLGFNAFIGGDDAFGAITVGPDGPLNPISIGAPGGSPISNIPFEFLSDVAPVPAVTLFGGFPSADFQFFLQALKDNQYVRILAEPTLVAMSGGQADFHSGGEFPVPIVQGTGGGNAISVQYRQFGVRVLFEPVVLGDNSIRLHVVPEVSDISDVGAVQIEGFSIPSVLIRRVETTLELKSGQSFAMAGLLNYSVSARTARVPLLGDLPVLGPLFRSVRFQRGETELLVLVTATVVEPSDRAAALPLPGDFYTEPDDWELFVEGLIEGRPQMLASPESEWLREKGFDRLEGPGAWETHGQPPAMGYGPIVPPDSNN